MKLNGRICLGGGTTEYPVWGMVLAVAMLMLSPFVTPLLVYPVFVLCAYRVIRYDEHVFATDYAMLIPISLLFQTSGGMSLMVYLCLFAAVWYFIRGGIRADRSYVLLILLLNYLILRMQFNISNFVLCFGQMCLLCVLTPKQDESSAERATKTFCFSLVLSSVYALVFRNTWQIEALRGAEVPAYWGSTAIRFYGLFSDPNYYSALLITALSLLLKLCDSRKLRLFPAFVMGAVLVLCGIMTYSRTFFVMLILLACVFVIWQFWSKRIIRGIFILLCAVLVGSVLLVSESSLLAVIIERFTNATTLGELTTGRSELFVAYFSAITEDFFSLAFGAGLAAGNLGRDPHNLFLEIAYYTGLFGLVLMICFYWSLLSVIQKRNGGGSGQNLISKYVVLFMVLLFYCTLHGMILMPTYSMFFFACLSTFIKKKDEASEQCQSC